MIAESEFKTSFNAISSHDRALVDFGDKLDCMLSQFESV